MRRNKPSRTAIQVGQALVLMGQVPEIAPILKPGLVEETQQLLLAVGAMKPWHLRLARSRRYQGFLRWLERRTVDGQFLNVALRKCFMEEETRAAIETGATQVLVVGAGFDTLTLRLAPEYSNVRFFEIDHPATQLLKLEGVEKLGKTSSNLQFVAADLAQQTLAETLENLDTWHSGATTVVIVEGVLMYLPENAVRTFFTTIRQHSGNGSKILFTHCRLDDSGQVFLGKRLSNLMRLSLRALGEPILWGLADGTRASFLESGGWQMGEPPERFDLRQRFLRPHGIDQPLGGIEFVAAADLPEAS